MVVLCEWTGAAHPWGWGSKRFGARCASDSVGKRPENKAQSTLSSTPFHWSLSSLSASQPVSLCRRGISSLTWPGCGCMHMHILAFYSAVSNSSITMLHCSQNWTKRPSVSKNVSFGIQWLCFAATTVTEQLAAWMMGFESGHLTWALTLITHCASDRIEEQRSQNLWTPQSWGQGLSLVTICVCVCFSVYTFSSETEKNDENALYVKCACTNTPVSLSSQRHELAVILLTMSIYTLKKICMFAAFRHSSSRVCEDIQWQ